MENNNILDSLKLWGGGLAGGVAFASGLHSLTLPAFFLGWEIGGCFEDVKVKDRIVRAWYSENGSFPNYIFSKSKLSFTKYYFVKNLLSKKDKKFYLDNFRFDFSIKNNLNLVNKFLASKAEKRDLYMSWEDLKRGSLILGNMGSGKTEFFKNIIVQWLETNKRMVVHDTKAEFTSYFFHNENDYIINSLDERGAFWDFFEDIENGLSVELVYQFFDAYFYAVAGESNDKFWSQSAFLRFKEYFNRALKSTESDKYKVLLFEIERYFNEVNQKNNKTEQSIAKTLEVAIDTFQKQYTQKVLGRKKFLVTEFFKNQNSKLFLQTVSEVSKENTPFLTAFLEVLFRYQLTNFEKAPEEEFTLYVLDEYLTFFEKMKEDLRTELHTKARSYGILLLPAVQYLPKDDKLKQNLTGSFQNLFVFNLSDLDTIKYVEELTKIKVETRNKFNKNETDFSEKELNLVDKSYIQSLKPGEHFTFILGGMNVLYKGYTKLPKVAEITKGYIKDNKFNDALINVVKDLKEEVLLEQF